MSKVNELFDVILLKKQTFLLFQVCANDYWHLFVANVQNSKNIVLTSIDRLNLRTDIIVIWLDKTEPVNVTDLICYYLHTFIRYKSYPLNVERITIINSSQHLIQEGTICRLKVLYFTLKILTKRLISDGKKGYCFKDLPSTVKEMLKLIQAESILDKHHLLADDSL
jgi:hypothetical protein